MTLTINKIAPIRMTIIRLAVFFLGFILSSFSCVSAILTGLPFDVKRFFQEEAVLFLNRSMTLLMMIAVLGSLLKLSYDDLKMHAVYHTDLIALSVLGLIDFQTKSLDAWLWMMSIVVSLALVGGLSRSMGSGDVAVIVVMGLTLSVHEWLTALSLASLMALFMVLVRKKARNAEVPFVPYLSIGWGVIYLIRLRLIFS